MKRHLICSFAVVLAELFEKSCSWPNGSSWNTLASTVSGYVPGATAAGAQVIVAFTWKVLFPSRLRGPEVWP